MRADDKLTVFLELERAVCIGLLIEQVKSYGRGGGVGRTLGVGATLGVGEGLGVKVGVGVGVDGW